MIRNDCINGDLIMGKGLRLSLFIICLIVSHVGYANNVSCELDNSALQSMSKSLVTFTRNDGSKFEVVVKTADDNAERAAGFQRVCAETIAAEPILFVFNSEFVPKFHMHNVVAPLDIAFITKRGQIDSIQKMSPYILIALDKPLYGPEKPVIGALETYPGFYEENNIKLDATVSWKPL